MKTFLILACLCFVLVSALPNKRAKRQAYALPDGVETLVGSVRTSFACPAGANGYYADVDNDCRIFHVCNTVTTSDGVPETLQYSFLCGNQTVFNQAFLTCAVPEEAIPCSSSQSFFYLNERIGDEKAFILTDQDVQNAVQLIPAYSAGGRQAVPAPPRPGPPPGRPGGFGRGKK